MGQRKTKVREYCVHNKFEGLGFWEAGKYGERYGLNFQPHRVFTLTLAETLCQRAITAMEGLGAGVDRDCPDMMRFIHPESFAARVPTVGAGGQHSGITVSHQLVPTELTIDLTQNKVRPRACNATQTCFANNKKKKNRFLFSFK